MSERAAIDLTPRQRAVLRDVFAPYADRFESVGVYGSRATGRARPGSDVDLVIYGSTDDQLVGSILTELEDSDLDVFADVVAFECVKHAKLRQHIVRDSLPLFAAAELIESRLRPAA